MAAELKKNFEVDAELFAEGNGIFDILVDASLIYSKYKTGHFPDFGMVYKDIVREFLTAIPK